ncbi:zinc permease [Kitasatospora sp. NPDC017646]|uniref:zinc permease n=1 Tax=Kitasatospora sp. NPDC017646 TaxID=3364024 RepID=UPI0037AE4D67
MSGPQIALLGAIAGLAIFLGLPIGRLQSPAARLRTALNAVAIGILLFLLFLLGDILTAAWEPTDAALSDHHWAGAATGGLVLTSGLAVGLMGLVYYDRWIARRQASRVSLSQGPGASAVTEQLAPRARSRAAGLALMIAIGIGLHNLAEGPAIGNSAAKDELSLAILLITGFGLHNATEGFGIVAPLAAAGERPSWGSLALLGLIGGGPTFVGTVGPAAGLRRRRRRHRRRSVRPGRSQAASRIIRLGAVYGGPTRCARPSAVGATRPCRWRYRCPYGAHGGKVRLRLEER